MFIINITYKTELENIDQHLEEHIDFLNEQYAIKNFIASGKKIPRTGGIILAIMDSKTELENIIEKDPFKKHELADYELIEFVPSKTIEELKFLIEK
ncbi:YciI family protein [Chondrinema litorale]|uniref:YciI family protein n=1 Tax=Chondrinema litorale TaxID=2994555 RepID=UPI0025428FF3|nr:YciI family protein [Chondrinema litorale]UZR97710.1 YciI family protein [Chondrinema litorale]